MLHLNKEDQFFIDSNFVIALIDERDVHHARSLEIMKELPVQSKNIFLSDLLLNEVSSVIGKRCKRRGKEQLFPVLFGRFQTFTQKYPILCLYELVSKQYRWIAKLMSDSKGHLSFHDSLILIFLKEAPLVKLVSFDKDFERFDAVQMIS